MENVETTPDAHVNDHPTPHTRRPIVISDDRLVAGARTAPIENDDPHVLLRQYLRLIRRARNRPGGRSIALRRADIDTIAAHLGWSPDQVLAHLADLMGATGRQRAAMLTVLATGASLITVVGPASVAADEAPDEMPIVVLHESPSVTATPARTARLAPSDGAPGLGGRALASSVEPTGDSTKTGSPPPPPSGDDTVAIGRPPQAGGSPTTSSPRPAGGSGPATADDDAPQIAVGRPPAPRPPGRADDGATVAVGRPPMPDVANEP